MTHQGPSAALQGPRTVAYRSIHDGWWDARLDGERVNGLLDITVSTLSITRIPVFAGAREDCPKGYVWRPTA